MGPQPYCLRSSEERHSCGVLGGTRKSSVVLTTFVLIGGPSDLSYLKSVLSNIQNRQFLAERLGRLTRPRDDRHSKAGSPAGKACAHSRARSGSRWPSENTFPPIPGRA